MRLIAHPFSLFTRVVHPHLRRPSSLMNIFLTILRYIPHAATVATAVYFFILNSARPTTDPSLYEGYDVYPFMVEGLLVSLATLIAPVVLMRGVIMRPGSWYVSLKPMYALPPA